MAILSLIQIFAAEFCGIILFFLGILFSYKDYALFIAIMTTCAILKRILFHQLHVRYSFIWTTGMLMIIGFMYVFITPLFYDFEPGVLYSGNFLSFIGQVIPSVLFFILISDDEKIQDNIKTLVPYIAILMTIVAFLCTISPNNNTRALVYDDTGFNYQNLSYMAAYAGGLSEYFIITSKTHKYNGIFNRKIGIILGYFMIATNFCTILLTGGRGGLVLLVITTFFSFWFFNRHNEELNIKIIHSTFLYLIILLISLFCLWYVNTLELETSGVKRIIGFLSGDGDSGRGLLRNKAIDAFISSPVIGHGFGSVFWELGEYSHNILTDILVELGIVGFLLFFYILRRFFKAIRIIIRNNVTEVFWLYIFMFGITKYMFSGYYLSSLALWISIFFSFNRLDYIQVKSDTIKSKKHFNNIKSLN